MRCLSVACWHRSRQLLRKFVALSPADRRLTMEMAARLTLVLVPLRSVMLMYVERVMESAQYLACPCRERGVFAQ